MIKPYSGDINVRHCNKCGKEMWEGYCIENGMEYYCSEECLHKNISEEEWEELYDEGNGDSYYTDWYDEKEEYNKINNDKKLDYFADKYYKTNEGTDYIWNNEDITNWITDEIKMGNTLFTLDDTDLLKQFQEDLYKLGQEELYDNGKGE